MVFLSEGVDLFSLELCCYLTCVLLFTVVACTPSPPDSLIPTYLLYADYDMVGLDVALACSLPLAQLWPTACDVLIILPR